MKKILHIAIAGPFTEGMSYQDNILPELNSKNNEVLLIVPCYKYKKGKLVKTKEEAKYLNANLQVIRKEYSHIINDYISEKIRKVKNLYEIIDKFSPNIILFHGTTAYELLTVVKYKKNNPSVKLYVDSHEDFNNSARNIISKVFLHKLFYKRILQKSLNEIDKILYISEETKYFLENLYKVPQNKLEFYPLGGIVIDKENKNFIRNKIRKELGISDEEILMIHSGKMNREKKTYELLQAFYKLNSKKITLIIIGNIDDERIEIKETSKIKYLGWKNSEKLREYIIASDIYLQPGSQSATSQIAVCSGLPLMLYPHPSYKKLMKGNVFWVSNSLEILEKLKKIEETPRLLLEMSRISLEYAREIFDYEKLAKRIEE